MNKYYYIFLLVLSLMSSAVWAENLSDTIRFVSFAKGLSPDSVITNEKMQIEDTVLDNKPYKPDPAKVIWMGAIIPGYGQIMNRKYWKLPIVYGGFVGCGYAIYFNATNYQKYSLAYRDIMDADPLTNSHLDVLPKGYTVETYGGLSGFQTRLKTAQETYRRNRDLSFIGTVGFYALTLVDAYVDAQLFDFDISPDLSLHIQPVMLQDYKTKNNVLAMQCSFNLR